MTSRRVLLTGGGGFVGANLARRLVADGHDLHLVLHHPGETWRLRELAGRFREHRADLRDPDAVRTAVADARPDWVFHLAAHGAYSWQTDVRTIYETNVLGLVNLLEACRPRGFEAFVNTGSSSEYGYQSHPPGEGELPEPNSAYAAAKAAATLYCRHVARATGLRVPTLRLYSVFGPYEEPNRLMPAVVVRGLGGECPPLVDPAIARDFVYVDDAVEAYLLAATVPTPDPGGVFNVGSGRQTTLREVMDLSGPLFPDRPPPAWGTMAPRAWDTTVWVSDPRKARAELGWSATRSVADGLQAFADWFRARPEMLVRYREALAPRAAA